MDGLRHDSPRAEWSSEKADAPESARGPVSAKRKRNMPLPRWALAFPNEAGRTGSIDPPLPTVASLSPIYERSLVPEAPAGNPAAFAELAPLSDRDALRLALNVIRRPEDARDVYQ